MLVPRHGACVLAGECTTVCNFWHDVLHTDTALVFPYTPCKPRKPRPAHPFCSLSLAPWPLALPLLCPLQLAVGMTIFFALGAMGGSMSMLMQVCSCRRPHSDDCSLLHNTRRRCCARRWRGFCRARGGAAGGFLGRECVKGCVEQLPLLLLPCVAC